MTKKIQASDLITKFYHALDEKWGYIWGTAGAKWTSAKQASLEAKYYGNPERYSDLRMSAQYGSKWIGNTVSDCSGLFSWAFVQLGSSILHGSNSIWDKYCSSKGELVKGKRDDGQPIKPGTAVFMHNKTTGIRGHIGLYVGNGEVIEAASTQKGVVKSKISRWDEWGELKDVIYNEEEAIPVSVLKRGSKGEAVVSLQTALNALGFDCGTADGIFGKKTEEAVKAFQTKYGLKADGIAGPDTQRALETAEPVPTEETVEILLPKAMAEELYKILYKKLEKTMLGE